ncbi:MAG TPA: type II toxin-antitoxin system VapC family toxin [Caulobacteraceae bacterium]|nr:type II toxin-antitoxin system VapC family toxin [Caulobacteraceae bacterium]
MALAVYADASVLVALVVPDAFNERAESFLDTDPILLISDFAAAEFASALGLRVRTGSLPRDDALLAFATFDSWGARFGPRLEIDGADVAQAERYLRHLDLNLRTPDAINIALAERHSAALATFDVRMADSARALGLELAPA